MTKKDYVRKIAMLFCILWLVSPRHICAQDARLENIIVTNTQQDLLLYLNVEDAFPPKIEKAVNSGFPAEFSFFINLYRVRGLWLDKQIGDITATHTLKYNNLKKKYIVTRSWQGDKPIVVSTFKEAQKLMTEVDSLIIAPLKNLKKGNHYQIRAKAELSRLTLPFYLHYVLFFVSFWDVETDWYAIDFIY
ncbi:MAG: DUF4390 domain-containing protein [Desulfobacteraceae bacterium]|nr:DUF4390 domain-containing protein [Desulfobacteraceae bacterium]